MSTKKDQKKSTKAKVAKKPKKLTVAQRVTALEKQVADLRGLIYNATAGKGDKGETGPAGPTGKPGPGFWG